MIAFISGEMEYRLKESAVISAGGIGYEVMMPQRDLDALPEPGFEVKVYTHMNVREDGVSLFGFLTRDGLQIFRQLISVNGVGPKGALAILSVLDADSLKFAIVSGDAKAICKAQGIGARSAQRIILDLKDKVDIEDLTGSSPAAASAAAGRGTDFEDAVEALVSLGYGRSEAMRAVSKIPCAETLDAEALLKAALKNL
ncbi:MAG: Holliday junction branch migration protein RuvA [Lachnospiraceae bacterium]|nr:Holliday junction branch migration protein RuvA [Lachnospiraceae bacterium]